MPQEYGDMNESEQIGDKEKLEALIQIWEKVVDVQMHFNDLCLRLRTAAITVLGVLFGAAGISYRYGGLVAPFGFEMHISSAFLLIGIGCLIAFAFVDRYWYHALLRGSVVQGELLELEISKHIPSVELTKIIREHSHSSLNITAGTKLILFYGVMLTVLLVALFFNVSRSADYAKKERETLSAPSKIEDKKKISAALAQPPASSPTVGDAQHAVGRRSPPAQRP